MWFKWVLMIIKAWRFFSLSALTSITTLATNFNILIKFITRVIIRIMFHKLLIVIFWLRLWNRINLPTFICLFIIILILCVALILSIMLMMMFVLSFVMRMLRILRRRVLVIRLCMALNVFTWILIHWF